MDFLTWLTQRYANESPIKDISGNLLASFMAPKYKEGYQGDLVGLLGNYIAPAGTSLEPDYDIEGFIRKYGKPDQSGGQHLTDEFKLPNHLTFSQESRYSSPDNKGGKWEGIGNNWMFSPSDFNLSQHSKQELIDYFKKRERRGTYLNLFGNLFEGTL